MAESPYLDEEDGPAKKYVVVKEYLEFRGNHVTGLDEEKHKNLIN